LLIYLAAINLAALIAMGTDKFRARNGSRRIPERTLFLLAWAGGSVGAIAGMFMFRHKTKHRSFRIGLPAILALQLLLAYCLWRILPSV